MKKTKVMMMNEVWALLVKNAYENMKVRNTYGNQHVRRIYLDKGRYKLTVIDKDMLVEMYIFVHVEVTYNLNTDSITITTMGLNASITAPEYYDVKDGIGLKKDSQFIMIQRL